MTLPGLHDPLLLLLGGLAIDALFGEMPAGVPRGAAPGRAGRPRRSRLFDRKLNRPSRSERVAPRARHRHRDRAGRRRRRARLGDRTRCAAAASLGAAVEALLIGILLAQRSLLRACRRGRRWRSIGGGLAAGRAAVSHIVGRDPATPRRGTASRAPRSKASPRISATASWRRSFWYLVARAAGPVRLQDGQHARQHDRAPHASATALSAGPRRGSTICSNLGAGAAQRAVARRRRRCSPAKRRPGRRLAIMLRDGRKHRSPNAGWPEGGDGRRARPGARRAAPLRRGRRSTIRGSAAARRAARDRPDIARALRLYHAAPACLLAAGARGMAGGACQRCSA